MSRARLVVTSALLVVATLGVPARAAVTADWSAYLLNVGHSSYGRTATAITVTNASTLTKRWTWTPDPGPPGTTQQLFASPTVVGGTVYIGANTGDFYAISESTGSVLWKQFVGLASVPGCPGTRGVTSTATVATDPTSGKLTVYVGGGDRNLYALDAATGGVVWKHSATPVGGYNWASPTVVNSHIYLGIAAIEDCGLIRGGEEEFDQSTGALLHTYWAVPRGVVGASIWTSAAATANGSSVYVTTGNDDPNGTQSGDSFSIVRLDGTTMAKKDIWTVPGLNGTEEDFGAASLREVETHLGFPVFVKPNEGGSTCGCTLVERPDQLFSAVQLALRLDETALIDAVTIEDARRVAKRLAKDGMLTAVVGQPKNLASKEPGG